MLLARFYNRLTKELKNKLINYAKPITFNKLKELVIRI